MIRIENVHCGGKVGQFRGNADMFGWKEDDGDTKLCHKVGAVQKAEWLDGKLRILCQIGPSDGNGKSQEMMALEGFQAGDFDKLWHYFQSQCNVYIKQHRRESEVSEENFDAAMHDIERAADMVDEAGPGSAQKKAREADLMKKIEGVRNGLEEAMQGDKQALCRVFAAGNCERIGRLRLVIDTVRLEVYSDDDRWLHLRDRVKTVESILRKLGAFKVWRPSNDAEDKSMARRWEEQHSQGPDEQRADNPLVDAKSSVKDPLSSTKPLSSGVPPMDPLATKKQARELILSTPDPVPDFSPSTALVPSPGPSPSPPNDMHLIGMQLGLNDTRSDSIFEGWVWKQSRFLKVWRRRWLVLSNDGLESLTARGGFHRTESINAGMLQRVYSADAQMKQSRCFCIVSGKRNFYMVCDDDAQKAEWIRMLSQIAAANPALPESARTTQTAGGATNTSSLATNASSLAKRLFSHSSTAPKLLNGSSGSSSTTPGSQQRSLADAQFSLSVDPLRSHYTREDSLLEGWVWKRSRFVMRWRRRWLVLTRHGLESMKTCGGDRKSVV